MRQQLDDRVHRNNVLFYVLMTVSCFATKSHEPDMKTLAKIEADKIDEEILKRSFEDYVWPTYERLGATDQVAKGTELLRELAEDIKEACALF